MEPYCCRGTISANANQLPKKYPDCKCDPNLGMNFTNFEQTNYWCNSKDDVLQKLHVTEAVAKLVGFPEPEKRVFGQHGL